MCIYFIIKINGLILYVKSVLFITITGSIPVGGLLVHEGIILPVVSASALTWFIRYIYY